MVIIEEIGLEKELLKAKFACDLDKCKGACCTFPGDYGAPVADDEIVSLDLAVEPAKKYLTENSKNYISNHSYLQGETGSYTTNVIDGCDCVFVFYDGDIAKCAIEKAYFNGETEFRKPISCHLFPIRATYYGGRYLYYEKIKECKPAVDKGEKENVKLIDFLKTPLEKKYGKSFFEEVCNLI
ncbi:MAG: DUF3109 family protein [Candidatus Kapabacteria bacterium]|nr:DUF3109 family protein [Candidatus Kapabacteria bacterium]